MIYQGLYIERQMSEYCIGVLGHSCSLGTVLSDCFEDLVEHASLCRAKKQYHLSSRLFTVGKSIQLVWKNLTKSYQSPFLSYSLK